MAKTRTDFQMGLDGKLTEMFNTNPVFRDFLIRKVRDLTNTLALSPYAGNVKFFVKGGTALKLLKLANNIPDNSAWSDWDTQIIINPNLSVQDWYTVFRGVQKIIINHILGMQVEWETLVATQPIATVSFTVNNTPYNNVPIAAQVNAINTLSTPIVHPNQTFDNAQNVLGNYPNDFDRTFELTQLSKELKRIPINAINAIPTVPINAYTYIMQTYFSSGQIDANTIGVLFSQSELNNAQTRISAMVNNAMDVDDDNAPVDVSDPFFGNLTLNEKLKLSEDFKAFLAQYQSQGFTHSSFTANTLISDFYLYRMLVRYELPMHLVNGTPFNNAAYKVPLRGELLDISIPRRDTAEGIHQYTQVDLLSVNVPANLGGGIIRIPNWLYQVQENIVLIVEVIEGRSGSPAKIAKRIARGFEALNNINPAVIPTTVQKLQGIAPNIYTPWMNSIQQNIGNNLPLTLIIMALLDSLEEDFKIGTVIPAPVLQQLTNEFNNLMATIGNDYTSVINTMPPLIPVAVTQALTPAEKAFIGTVQFARRVSKMFGQVVNPQNLQYISEISAAFTQRNIPNVLAPQISALLVMAHLGYTPSVSSQRYVYPYFDIFVSQVSNLNQVTAFNGTLTFLSQNGFVITPSPGNQPNNSVYILIKNGIRMRVSHSPLFNPAGNSTTQTLNGRSLLKNSDIISELNRQIANTENIHTAHWLDGLRKDFQKALTTF